MTNINKVFLIGNLTKNPEIKKTKSDKIMVILRILTIENIKSNKIYNWHRIILYNELADLSEKLLNEGDLIFIQGRIQNRKWVNENNEIKYITEVIANEMKLLKKDINKEIDKKLNNFKNFDFDNNLDIKESEENYDIKLLKEKFKENQILEDDFEDEQVNLKNYNIIKDDDNFD